MTKWPNESISIRRAIGLIAVLLLCSPVRGEQRGSWQTLEPGLDLGTFEAPTRSELGDSLIRILRIDPAAFHLRLLNASATPEGKPQSARQWVERHGLVAAINASMYQADHRSSVSFMKTHGHTNNPRLSKDNAILAFDPAAASVPPVQIIDRTCQNFDDLKDTYSTFVQSIRMVSCDRKNVWGQKEEEWSTAAIGTDMRGRALFIHVRSPFSTHDLIDMLLALPIELKNAMYVEGGPQAQLFIAAGGQKLDFLGGYDGVLASGDGTEFAFPIPNVVAVERLPKSPTKNVK